MMRDNPREVDETADRLRGKHGSMEVSAEFGISKGDEAHLMQILRDTLYSDKVLAVLREYSSNAWDAHAASAFGMRVVWCNRYGQRRERLPGTPDREIRSLAELPALLVRG